MIKNRRNLLIIIALIAIIGVSLYIRSYYIRTDGDYMLAFDPYYHYRMADTIVDQGTRPEWDDIAAYPTGSPVQHPPLFHYYLAYTYKIVSVFSSMTLFQWCIYANIIPTIIAVVAAFYAGKALTNDVGGLFTAMFASVNGAIASRTVIGYTDTDIWIVMFSFVVSFFLFKTIKSEKKYLWSILLGFSLFLFGLTWTGHWHLPLLVFGSFIVYLVMDAVRKNLDRNLLSGFALSFLAFLLPWTVYQGLYTAAVPLAVLGIIWVLGGRFFTQLRTRGMPVLYAVIVGVSAYVLYIERVFLFATQRSREALQITSSESRILMMPDISISILQRGEVTLSSLMTLYSVLLLVAIFGIVLLIWKRTRFSVQALVYVALYFLGTGILLLFGGRYTMLFAIPLILAGGAFFGILPDILQGKVTSKGVTAVVLVCSLSVVPCYMGGAETSEASSAMNDDLWEALVWINENTPEDAVIIAGWDAGYWIESIAKRKSVMNGAHYDIQWRVVKFGKLIETQDETVAMKEVYGFSDESEVKALRAIPEERSTWPIEHEMAGFAEDNAYILVSEWTALTFYWLSYFGNWNYVTGEGEGRIYNPMWAQDARKLISATEYIYGTENISFSVALENGDYHSFILDQSGYVPTMGTIFLKDRQTYFLKRDEGDMGVIYVPPENIALFKTEVVWPDAPSEVLLIKQEDLECMLTRLYFFNGEGLHYFELVKDTGTAKVFKVHKVPQEFDQGVITETDTYMPI
jgi:hypothetical protein